MPAHRLGTRVVDVRRYDVAGQDSDGPVNFVRHVGLASEQRDGLSPEFVLSLTHMGPPLERSEGGNPIQTLGTVPLNTDEILQIGVFVDELLAEYEAQRVRRRDQYVILPHARDSEETDGTVVCRRFNCAGFVIEAYREAGMDLLVTDLASLPPISLETLVVAYSDFQRLLGSATKRRQFGLEGPGPWPVVLAGYVLNALNREESAIRAGPYQPQTGDEFFPPQGPPPSPSGR